MEHTDFKSVKMDLNNPQFDSFIGGTETVPNSINLSEFIKNRMEEVIMLTEAIKESPFRGQTFQRLPKHMRRRQMSHHVKRLPRKLQRPYLLSLKESVPEPPKRPSRKYRRRPSNLLAEYNRRQKKHTWLETHIWHAKRFHMVEKWGYKLAHHPTNKGFKACYRAISEHCLLIDKSYYNCIELSGPENVILQGLNQCTSCDCGLTFGAKVYISGMREGFVTLFHPNSYPSRVIGDVSFMWQPKYHNNNRKIWIWTHPLMHEEIVKCFSQLFKLVCDNKIGNDLVSEKQEKVKKKNVNGSSKENPELTKLIPKNVPFFKTPKFKSDKLTMTLLKDTLNRFQLIGPMAQAIMSQAFNVISVKEEKSDVEIIEVPQKKMKLDDEEVVEVDNNSNEEGWWVKYFQNDNFKECWTLQKQFYDKLSEQVKPTDVPPQMILSLIVEDPRLTIPPKREKAVPTTKKPLQIQSSSINPSLSQSPLWDPEVRDKVSMTKLSTYEINMKRSMKIVPGSDVKDIIPDNKLSRIPILLVQTPGRSDARLGLGSSWDIIAPANFGMAIWLSLVFRGGRAGGLREYDLMNFECNNFKNFPQPDSAAGEEENQRKYQELIKRYFELPPSKRSNFIKLGVLSPFYPLWKVLVKDWINKTNPQILSEDVEVSVLRNRKVLAELSEIVGKLPNIDVDLKFGSSECNYLIPVVIEMVRKGKANELDLICLPNEGDLKTKSDPKEPVHLDENEKVRKLLKSQHSTLLKSLRRKRKKEKENSAESKSTSASSKPHSEAYNSKMRDLWLPNFKEVQTIVNSGSRPLVGFVTFGGFSMSKSRVCAMGYVTLFGLLEAFKISRKTKSPLSVLIRNKNQTQYRFGKIKIPIE